MKYCRGLSSLHLGGILWLTACVGIPNLIGAGSILPEAWQALSTEFYDDAVREFAASGNSREARLGIAMAQFNQPPVSSASLAEAQRQLEELTNTNDEIGHAALYYLARLRQWHPIKPDPSAAAQLYERLVNTRADDRWCRLALIKLAILRLAVLPSPGDLPSQFAAVELFLGRTTDSVTKRDLHLVIAEVRLHRELYDSTTLGHLQSALSERTLSADLRADLLVQIGRMALKFGDPAMACAHFTIFLKEFPKDRRHYEVRQMLEHPGQTLPP